MEAYGAGRRHPGRLQGDPDKLNAVSGFTEGDFPVVAFFNASGFDGSGGIDVLRRARDGEQLYKAKDKPKLVKVAVARRDGKFRAYFWDWTAETVAAKEWYARYMGVEQPQVLPPPEELDKMTPEQLQKLGIERLTADEYEKKFGVKPPPPGKEPAKEPVKAVDTGKQGVRGRVFQLPLLAPVETEILAFPGRLDPKAPVDRGKAVAMATTDKTGVYTLPLLDGTYTLLVAVGTGWQGNAVKAWPAVEVKGGWVDDYDFRLAPR
jgi:hypothetical protein